MDPAAGHKKEINHHQSLQGRTSNDIKASQCKLIEVKKKSQSSMHMSIVVLSTVVNNYLYVHQLH